MPAESPALEEELPASLGTVARGTLVVFLGLCANALFRFLSRMVLARGLTERDYGVIVLGLVIMEFAAMLGVMGMGVGSARFISRFRAHGDASGVRGTVRASLRICSASGLVLSALIWSLSGVLSDLFEEPALAPVLRLLAFAVPFSILLDLLVGIFRGFERVRVKVFFEDLLLYGSAVLAVVLALRAGAGTSGIALAYLAAYLVSGALLCLYASRALPPQLGPERPRALGSELLAFSLPLALESLLNLAVFWTDTLMLGLMRGSGEVGIYNAAVPFANLLPIFLVSAIYIFLPVVTRALAAGRREEARVLYRSVTKWTFLLTMPLFLFFLLFPREIIVFFAGEKYGEAGVVLAILSLGFLGHVFLGPNGMTLVALGRTRLVLLDGAVCAGSNVVLNYLFISAWGMKGAALASSLALLLGNVLRTLQVYRLSGIHPFSGRYLKPVLLAGLVGTASFPLASWAMRGRGWVAMALYPLYLAAILALVVLSRSLEREDLFMLSGFTGGMFIRARGLVRFLERFVCDTRGLNR